MPTQKAPGFVQTSKHVKTLRPSVKPVEHHTLAKNLKKYIPMSRGHRHSWNRKACFVCKSLTHLIKDCDYYEKKMVQKPLRNHAMRGNHQHYARMTHTHPHRQVVPTTVLTRSRLVPLIVARPVTAAVPQTNVQHQRPTKWMSRETGYENLNVKSMEDMLLLVEIQKVVRSQAKGSKENNMYNVDLKNIVPSGDLTYLFAKAALDESNL
uniref:Uncharacterized protein n=1 Tax=Tanacetum cinerariifolium TaxID=118510 RepID=A0A699JKK6_TANCI|nr:hypothetical protein [Tanacetum cinerariifolium]